MSGSDAPRFMQSTPVLRSADYPRSRAFYADSLGFDIDEEGGVPPRFGIFRRGRSIVYVNAWNGPPGAHQGGWDAYFHVEGLETLFESYRASGVPLTRPIEETVYGMREFEVTDPDGNILCFGEDLPAEPEP